MNDFTTNERHPFCVLKSFQEFGESLKMMKVLYLIIAYKNPEQLTRLVKTIKKGSSNAQVLIHYDSINSKIPLNPSNFDAIDGVYIVEDPIAIKWGHFSWIAAVLNCLEWSINHHLNYDWLVLLSGQDYPIQPINKIENFLDNTEYDGFMEYFPFEDPPNPPQEFGLRWLKDTGFVRFHYRYYRLPDSIYKFSKRILFRLDKMTQWQSLIRIVVGREGTLIGFKNPSIFTKNFSCYTGSNWLTLSARCIQYIVEFAKSNPELIKHYKYTAIPEESFFQTILINAHQFKIMNDHKRYIKWDYSNTSNPAILSVSDFDCLLSSNQHFARKFDIDVDAQILDLLDQYLDCRHTDHILG